MPDEPSPGGIPAFVNSDAGSAGAAKAALAAAGSFAVVDVAGADVEMAVRRAMDQGARRVVVAGGDGSVAAAAAVLAGTGVELAVLPGGTLNHFARDLGIPTDADAAARAATSATTRAADVAVVNGRIFLNTSSVGAYVVFVRTRERLEQHLGYRAATLLAAASTFWRLRRFGVEVEVDGERRIYNTPIVFIGVGERELQLPKLGSRVADGRAGLHVFVVRGRTRAALVALALAGAARGVQWVSRTPALDSFLVDRARIVFRRRKGNVAVDGELVPMTSPLEYELRPNALRVVVPDPAG